METVIIVIHLILAVALVVTVLLQQSEGGALGIGGNPMGGFMTGRGRGQSADPGDGLSGGRLFCHFHRPDHIGARHGHGPFDTQFGRRRTKNPLPRPNFPRAAVAIAAGIRCFSYFRNRWLLLAGKII